MDAPDDALFLENISSRLRQISLKAVNSSTAAYTSCAPNSIQQMPNALVDFVPTNSGLTPNSCVVTSQIMGYEGNRRQTMEIENMGEASKTENTSCNTVALTRQYVGSQVDSIIEQANAHLKIVKSQKKKSVSFNKEIKRIIVRLDNIGLDPSEVQPPLPFKLNTIDLEFANIKKRGIGRTCGDHRRSIVIPQPKLPSHLEALLHIPSPDDIIRARLLASRKALQWKKVNKNKLQMEPSDDMSSLMELVNSQLNEISIQMGPARNIASAVYETTGVQLPTPEFQFSLMSLNCGHSFKSDPVVAQQIANTIKAREIRQQEEANKAMIESAEAIKRENLISQPMEYLIDFKDAIIEQDNLKLEKIKQENPPIGKLDYALLNSNKVRPLFETSTKKSGNTGKTRLSTIGKVLCARYCPNPTIRTDPKIKYVLHVSPHLKGPSPDDIIKEKMKKEVRNFDVMSFYGLEPSTALQSSANKKKGVKGKKSQHKPNFNKTPQRDRIPPHHKK